VTKPRSAGKPPRHRPGAAPRRRWGLLVDILAAIALIVAAYIVFRPTPKVPVLAEAGQVQSAVEQDGDSLRVIVRWQLATPPTGAAAESLRVEVQIDSMGAAAARVSILPERRRSDTLYVPAPAPGASADGLSCVAAQHHTRIARESCTPWRYVRPLAEAPNAARPGKPGVSRARAAQSADEAVRIVVQPGGLQVDPDIGGRCAAWQRRNPTASVWIDVNRIAVPACTGPNNRPTVAQFCAFAELADGRRVKTANAANIPYCDALFRRWERERIS
jgi:hypothetical protein